jgi:DNA-directed RNA polymerase subunit beta'
LVDVSQDVIIRELDCHTTEGIEVYDIRDGKDVIEGLEERLLGRYPVEDIVDKDGNVIVSKDKMMDEVDAKNVVKAGIERVQIRSIMTCRAKHGVCAKCYGANLSNKKTVSVGEAVGVIAAQSIGEPGTQLTMRTFHTGGIANAEDITQGLPRVEELFEARKPKTLAIIAEIDGVVSIEENNKGKHVIITNEGESKDYLIPYGSRVKVLEGTQISAGDMITEGSACPVDILAVKGEQAVQDYLIAEVQKTYRVQGVDINDKHVEVIVRQMMKKVRVDDQGDTSLLAGMMVEKSELISENEKIQARIDAGEITLRKATYIPVLLGITKASLATDSFLSAASFQETTRVLTDAAIKGKVDTLMGLKENVIIGKLIPAGTGMQCYCGVENIPTNPDDVSFQCSLEHEEKKALPDRLENIVITENDDDNTVNEEALA